jgi:hypothetical protein
VTPVGPWLKPTLLNGWVNVGQKDEDEDNDDEWVEGYELIDLDEEE